MTPKIWASIEAISYQFAQRQTAIRWLEWLHRKLSNNNSIHLTKGETRREGLTYCAGQQGGFVINVATSAQPPA
jgi:hypothetical protein